MRSGTALLVLSLIAFAPAAIAAESSFKVAVTNIDMKDGQAKGKVYVCLYPSSVKSNADFPSCEIADVKKVVVTAFASGKGVYTFSGLQAGQYALTAFQDVDGFFSKENGKLDMIAGVPIERVGTFKPMPKLAKPTFDDISFSVPEILDAEIKLIGF
jgi:uncharacterized protein (DUF2141 family)